MCVCVSVCGEGGEDFMGALCVYCRENVLWIA